MIDAKLFSAGDCPVCSDSGALLGVTSIATGDILLFCPLCGTAWRERPLNGRVDAIHSLEELAPIGISLPKSSQVRESPLGPFLEVDGEEWLALIISHLSPTRGSSSD